MTLPVINTREVQRRGTRELTFLSEYVGAAWHVTSVRNTLRRAVEGCVIAEIHDAVYDRAWLGCEAWLSDPLMAAIPWLQGLRE